MKKLFIRINNFVTRMRIGKGRLSQDHVLLLVPHCLQRTDCKHNVIHDLDQCVRCGRCNIADLLTLRDEWGLSCKLASGGRQAVAAVRDPAIRAIVAVACEKELVEGIRAAFPKPVLAVPNQLPHGPCKDTCFSVELLRSALAQVVESTS